MVVSRKIDVSLRQELVGFFVSVGWLGLWLGIHTYEGRINGNGQRCERRKSWAERQPGSQADRHHTREREK